MQNKKKYFKLWHVLLASKTEKNICINSESKELNIIHNELKNNNKFKYLVYTRLGSDCDILL